MKTTQSFFLAFCVCLLMMGRALAAPFVSPHGYVLTPTPGWAVNRTGMMGTDVLVYIRVPGGFAPNLNVVITPAPPGQRLDTALPQIKAIYPKMFTGFQMGQTGYGTLGGVRALTLTGTYQQGANRLSMRQAIAIRSGHVYTFTCTEPVAMRARFDPAFTQMLASIRWGK